MTFEKHHPYLHEYVYTIQWEDGTTTNLPTNQFAMNNIYFLTF